MRMLDRVTPDQNIQKHDNAAFAFQKYYFDHGTLKDCFNTVIQQVSHIHERLHVSTYGFTVSWQQQGYDKPCGHALNLEVRENTVRWQTSGLKAY